MGIVIFPVEFSTGFFTLIEYTGEIRVITDVSEEHAGRVK
jgi:hypothetical protein